jgi:hypothetical protein
MSLLLTRHIDEYCINIRRRVRARLGADSLRPGRLEPLADQLTVKIIMLHHQHALHARNPR